MKALIVGISFFGALAISSASLAEPICNIASEKKELIRQVLCGQHAPEAHYHESGPGCAERSVRKRTEDTAVQLRSLRLCGDDEFADRLQEANVRAMEFFEILAVCANETIDMNVIMEESVSLVEQKIAGMTCTPRLRATISRRKPELEAMVESARDQNIVATILNNLAIRVEENGNIVER